MKQWSPRSLISLFDESWWKNHDPFTHSPFPEVTKIIQNPHQTRTVSFVTAWAWVPSISNERLPLRKWCVKRRQTMRRERGKSQQRCGLEHSVLDDGVLKCYVNMWVFCTVIFWHVFFPLELFILFYFILSFCLLGPIFYAFCLNFLKDDFNIMYIYIQFLDVDGFSLDFALNKRF